MPAVLVTGLAAKQNSLFLPISGRNNRPYSLLQSLEGWPG